jgi:hypothetical protein
MAQTIKRSWKRTISFGHHIEHGKRYAVLVDVKLKKRDDNKKGWVFSATAQVGSYNCIIGGQCFDSLRKDYSANFTPDQMDAFDFIYRLWDEWHLNDMRAGTPDQMKALKGFSGGYTEQCDYLEARNLLHVEREGKTKLYCYGDAWLMEQIDDVSLDKMKCLVGYYDAEMVKTGDDTPYCLDFEVETEDGVWLQKQLFVSLDAKCDASLFKLGDAIFVLDKTTDTSLSHLKLHQVLYAKAGEILIKITKKLLENGRFTYEVNKFGDTLK